jgi:thymidylate synthase (FAD)
VKIIEPSFKLSTPFGPVTEAMGVQMLQFIEAQARISHRSEDKQGPDTWQRFIKAVVLDHGDWSVTEHASITATIRTDRGITHEQVRHRLFGFTQESTRFVRYKGEMEFVYPINAPKVEGYEVDPDWQLGMEYAEKLYQTLLAKKWAPEEARSVLPTALASIIAVTGNLRMWRHFFLMRTSKETHKDFRRITIPMLEEFKKAIPLLYDDIEPNQRQVENLRKAR